MPSAYTLTSAVLRVCRRRFARQSAPLHSRHPVIRDRGSMAPACASPMRGASAPHAGGEQRGVLALQNPHDHFQHRRLSSIGSPFRGGGQAAIGQRAQRRRVRWSLAPRHQRSAQKSPAGRFVPHPLAADAEIACLETLSVDGLNVPFSSELRPTDTGTRAGEALPGAVGGGDDCTFGASPATQSRNVAEVSW